ncbi:MAG: DUF3417 domain-containing protein, partial [Mucinivorans sp.]
LESIAFGVPTITTTLAGFGLWVNSHAQGEHHGVMVIPRTDSNSEELVAAISSTLATYAAMPKMEMELLRSQSMELSQIALWSNLFINYEKAYTMALDTAQERIEALRQDGGEVHEQVKFLSQQVAPACGPAWTRMIVERSIPQELHSLEVLTKNLWWSWNDSARWLFESIDPELWSQVDRNPIAMLDHLTLSDLKKLVADDDFLSKLNDVYAQFQAYMAAKDGAARPKIAYFSMEFGLHASLKIYSGGLGILAGDYLKESSDKNVPMTGVGLLYRYGYFTQRLSNAGEQEAGYEPQNFDKLPITPVRDEKGEWKTVKVSFPGRDVYARIWRCDVG